jgi:hypothetical protein
MRTRPVLISIAVHGTVLAAIVWTTSSRELTVLREPGVLDGGIGGSVGGLAAERPKPPLGPSLSPDEAKDYVGRYSVENPGRPNVEMLIGHVHDAKEHWSLLIDEGNRYPYMLIPIARDSFSYQLDSARRVVFVRRDTAVVAIELHSRGEFRRGAKVR